MDHDLKVFLDVAADANPLFADMWNAAVLAVVGAVSIAVLWTLTATINRFLGLGAPAERHDAPFESPSSGG